MIQSILLVYKMKCQNKLTIFYIRIKFALKKPVYCLVLLKKKKILYNSNIIQCNIVLYFLLNYNYNTIVIIVN